MKQEVTLDDVRARIVEELRRRHGRSISKIVADPELRKVYGIEEHKPENLRVYLSTGSSSNIDVLNLFYKNLGLGELEHVRTVEVKTTLYAKTRRSRNRGKENSAEGSTADAGA